MDMKKISEELVLIASSLVADGKSANIYSKLEEYIDTARQTANKLFDNYTAIRVLSDVAKSMETSDNKININIVKSMDELIQGLGEIANFSEEFMEENIQGARWLNVYRITRAYGGAEEGGWWYDDREVLETLPYNIENQRKLIEKYKLEEWDEGVWQNDGEGIEVLAQKIRGKSSGKPHYE